jgi:hypothetical protein
VVFVRGDLGSQRFGSPFHLTGAYLYPRQFAQQTLLSTKLTSAAALPVMRKTPGVSENISRCR